MTDKNEAQLYLFIIWEKSRNKTDVILEDLEKKFVIRDVYEIKWKEENFLNNLQRFYGKSLPDVEEKGKLCGIGPFLAIIVSDLHPKFLKTKMIFERDLTNININDSKVKYRKWIGEDFTVHSSISKSETSHNVMMIFGKNIQEFEKQLPKKWMGEIKRLESDLIGYNGWKDIEQLLVVLNETVNYVVLRNFESMPTKFDYRDIDLLVEDDRMTYIIDKEFSPLNKNPRDFECEVGNKMMLFNPNYLGDHYYDEKWEKDILKRRILHPNGFYVPCKEDYFYTLLFHVTFHPRWKKENKISNKYKKILSNLATELDIKEITEKTLDDFDGTKKMVETYMTKMSYRDPCTTYYKIRHNEFSRLAKSAIFLAKTQGIGYLIFAIKLKIEKIIHR